MIIRITDDILNTQAEALINTVNCVGVMGKGLALRVQNRYPGACLKYKEACYHKIFRPGMIMFSPLKDAGSLRYIIHFATKDHWKNKSQYEWIELGLSSLVLALQVRGLTSVAIPRLGCGLGGLDWKKVRPMIVERFKHSPINALIYE